MVNSVQVAVVEMKSRITEILEFYINNGVPAFVISPVLKSLFDEVSDIEKNQYQGELSRLKQIVANNEKINQEQNPNEEIKEDSEDAKKDETIEEISEESEESSN